MIKLIPSNIDKEVHNNDFYLEWLKDQLYPGGIHCHRCKKVTKHYKVSKRSCYVCSRCGNQVYPTKETILYKSSTPLSIWFKVIALVSNNKNISAKQIQREYGMTYKTAWGMVKKIKHCLDEGTLLKAGTDNVGKDATVDTVNIEDKQSTEPLGSRPLIGITPDQENNIKEYNRKRDRTARLLKLQILLHQNPQGLTPEEIARKCLISKRTAYRDLTTLESELGVPVWENRNRRGLAEGYFLPPITFTKAEAFNIFVSSRLLQKYSYSYNPSFIATLMKLNTITPEPIKKQIQNSIEIMEKEARDENKIKNLTKLMQAWLSQHSVKIHYDDAMFGKEPVDLIIDPYYLEPIYFLRSFLVIAYCHADKQIYSFKLHHVKGDIIICPETYKIPDAFNAFNHIDFSLSSYSDDEPINVKLHFTQQMGKFVMETIWHPSQKIELQNDGSIIASYRIANTIEFRSWILGFGDNVKILEPESFRQQIINMIKDLARLYSL